MPSIAQPQFFLFRFAIQISPYYIILLLFIQSQ